VDIAALFLRERLDRTPGRAGGRPWRLQIGEEAAQIDGGDAGQLGIATEEGLQLAQRVGIIRNGVRGETVRSAGEDNPYEALRAREEAQQDLDDAQQDAARHPDKSAKYADGSPLHNEYFHDDFKKDD
jgi:hypothetical protein